MKTRTLVALAAGCGVGLAVSVGSAGLNDGEPGDGKLVPKPIEKPAMFDPQIAELYQQAVIMYRSRRYDEAATYCRRILTLKTNELNAAQLLRDISDRRLRDPARAPGDRLKRKLSEIILPEFKAVEAVARDAVAFLQDQSGRHTADRTPVNLVWNVPAGQKVPLVTLSLYRVSLADVLQYLTEANGLILRYDENAAVISKPGPPAGANPLDDAALKTGSTPLKKKLRETVLPEFRVANAAPREAVTQLQELSGKLSTDQTPVNIVWNVPAEQPVPPVTLALYKIPMADALRYIIELSGLRCRVDERAVVIAPADPPDAGPAATTKP